jgi:hypothetical protein
VGPTARLLEADKSEGYCIWKAKSRLQLSSEMSKKILEKDESN